MELHSLPSDTIDLIATAAIDFHVLTTTPGSVDPHRLITAAAQRFGTMLYKRNHEQHPSGYLFRPVDTAFDVPEVLKACHAAQFAYRTTPAWIGSRESQIVDAVAKAASMRVPGYTNAPWLWRRPQENAIGFANGWTPDLDIEDLRWLDTPAELLARWERAHLIFIAWDCLEELPYLTPRPRVWAVAPAEHAAEATELASQHPELEGVLLWPHARSWLEQRVRG